MVLAAVVGVMFQTVLRENFRFSMLFSVKSCENVPEGLRIVRVFEGKGDVWIRG